MKNKIIIGIITFCIFSFAGCKQDIIVDTEGDRMVMVSVSSSLKALTEEEAITELLLYTVDNVGVVLGQQIVTSPSSEFSVIASRFADQFYAIANPTTDLKNERPSKVEDLAGMIADFSNAPVSPLLMSGKGNISGNKAEIDLIRSVAKIEISGNSDFTIGSVTVLDTPDK